MKLSDCVELVQECYDNILIAVKEIVSKPDITKDPNSINVHPNHDAHNIAKMEGSIAKEKVIYAVKIIQDDVRSIADWSKTESNNIEVALNKLDSWRGRAQHFRGVCQYCQDRDS